MIGPFRDEYRWLSNFWFAEITIGAHTPWNDPLIYVFKSKTNEHAYQALKAQHKSDFLWICAKDMPGQAKRGGKEITLRADWDEVKLDIMYDINRAKYTQHRDLRAKLINTGEEELVEVNSWFDTFWGVCNGKGENHLGKILMRIREELK